MQTDRLASNSLIHRQPASGEAKTNITARNRVAQLTPVAAQELTEGTVNLPESHTREKVLLGGTLGQFYVNFVLFKGAKNEFVEPHTPQNLFLHFYYTHNAVPEVLGPASFTKLTLVLFLQI